MKVRFLIPVVALTILALQGCIKEKESASERAVPQMTIRVSMPEDATKAGFTVPGSGVGLHLAWQAGDAIRVISGANSALYEIQPGFTDQVASFSGPVLAGDSFDIVVPGTYASAAEAEAGDANLTQTGNGSTEHLVFTAKLTGVAKEDLPDIGFTDAWVAAHAGTELKRGGIVKMALTLPNAVTAPKKVVLKGLGDDIAVNVEGVSLTSEHVLTVYAQSGWDDVAITAGSEFSIDVFDADESRYAVTKTIASDKTFKAGAQNIFTIADGFAEQLFAGGDGSQVSPYLLANAKQLDNMHASGILKHQDRVYFRLIKDIDMASYLSAHPWVPLNWESPYDYLINFDGDNHTIDNFTCSFDSGSDAYNKPSFFGLLYGECYDVRFTNASITTNSGTAGILGGYVGYNGKKAEVYNVHVQGSVTKTAAEGDTGVGGFAGRISYAYIDSSSADVVVNVGTVQNYVGGLFGIDFGDGAVVRNCWTSGSVTGSQRVGGICGGLIRNETQIINCFSTAAIECTYAMGGIAGHCNLDKTSSVSPSTTYPDNVIRGCIAWQSSLAVRDPNVGGSSHYSSGAIVAYTSANNYLENCLRRSDMSFQDYSNVYSLYDQENASPTVPLVTSGSGSYNFPYHGKSFNGTLSQAAKSLNWDETVWDLSGSTPVLTGAVEARSTEEAPESGNVNVPAGTNTDRAFPEPGTRNGMTWDVVNVAPGITYYHAIGTPTESWMDGGSSRKQEVYVTAYNLTVPGYDVKIVCTSPALATSEVFKQTGAIAAINGGYEKASVAIKGNAFLEQDANDPSLYSYYTYPSGYPYSFMPNNTIGDTDVANWKNEGTFYTDGHRDVRIAFDAYNGGCTDNNGTGTTVKGLKEMRNFYKLTLGDEPGFMSSAPVLAANYKLFGRTFASRNPNQGSNSEEPARHQSEACPRTAVAIAYPDGLTPYLLLIVCDGRYADSVGAYGMSALWLTRYIANYFGPRYMLNLDGGGSTTMCVQGMGDGNTHVVNYPCDNRGSQDKVHNHAGQRARDTFIVIVPSE